MCDTVAADSIIIVLYLLTYRGGGIIAERTESATTTGGSATSNTTHPRFIIDAIHVDAQKEDITKANDKSRFSVFGDFFKLGVACNYGDVVLMNDNDT